MADLALTLSIPGAQALPVVARGQARTLQITASDGSPVAATGVALELRKPDGSSVVLSGGGLTPGVTGTWTVAVTFDLAGTWVAQATCTGPTAAISPDLPIGVAGSAGDAPVPAPPAPSVQDAAASAAKAAQSALDALRARTALRAERAPTPRDCLGTGDQAGDLWVAPPSLVTPRIWRCHASAAATASWFPDTPANSYLLDHLGTSSLIVAKGMIKLRAAYAGACCRVERADTTQADIGWVKAWTGETFIEVMDAAALAAFVGTGAWRTVTWYDQSAAAAHGTQGTAANRPIAGATKVCGLPAMCFDTDATIAGGTDKWLTVSGAPSFSPRNMGLIVAGRMGQSAMANCLIQFGTTSYRIFAGFGASDTPRMVGQGGTDCPFTSPVTPSVLVVSNEGASSSTTFVANSLSATVPWATAPTAASFTTFKIGGDGVSSSDGRFDLLAWVLYGRALTAQERQDARAILGRATGIRLQRPDVVLGADGDSNTYGAGSTFLQTRMSDLQARLPGLDLIYSIASSGSTLAGRNSLRGTLWPAIYTPHASARRFIAMCGAGRKDLSDGQTPAQVYATLLDLTAYWRTLGSNVRVLWVTHPHRNGVAYDTMDSFNALIRAGAATQADALADVAADPVMGARGAELNSVLTVDGQHNTSAGHSLVAAIKAAAIEPLLL